MDTSRFEKPDDGFDLLGLEARFSFKTETSISFDIGRVGPLSVPEGEDPEEFRRIVGDMSAFIVMGWIDVHHPCEGPIQARLRIHIPAEYHQFERMEAIAKVICEALSIPPGERCETTYFDSPIMHAIIPLAYLGMGPMIPEG